MSKTLLIVEDDQFCHDLYEAILESTDYRVIHAYHGNDALAKLETNKPDLIIIDISLVMMTSVTFFLYLRSKQEYLNIPVIIVTNALNRTYESLSKIDPNLVISDKTVRSENLIMTIKTKIENENMALV